MPAPNWANQTVWTGDNLPIMRGMNSASVDLIYLDPPFNSKANYAAPIGSKAAGAEFKDTWTLSDVDAEWINLIESKYPALHRVLLAAMTDSDKSYLAYMAARLLEMRRLLKPTGSIYLHCDPTMSHYLKLLMDAVFGREQFQNEIIWSYRRWPSKQNRFQRMHDVLFLYTSGGGGGGHTFNVSFEPPSTATLKRFKGKQVLQDPVTNSRKLTTGKRSKGTPQRDVWDIGIIAGFAKERTGYPTQKPLALLERIIEASTNEGDMVLDPFCGCATTLVSADSLARQWVGIDISAKAADLVRDRLNDLTRSLTHRTDVPRRTDLGKLPRYNSQANRQRLYGLQEGHCAGCSEHFAMRHLEVDHIIAQRKGGTDHIENLQLLCGNCNRIKGDRGMDYLRAKLQL